VRLCNNSSRNLSSKSTVAGIALSSLTIKLVNQRIVKERGIWSGANALNEWSTHTDIGELPNYRTHRHRLYGEQEGICVGCNTHFSFKVMDVDHILPRKKGGKAVPITKKIYSCFVLVVIGVKTVRRWQNGSDLEGAVN